jgi:tetratricopeptide (TPR) repeat protein
LGNIVVYDGNAGSQKGNDSQWTLCHGGEIQACTNLIDSGRETKRDLAIDYSNRGHAYKASGEYDKAIADYNVAISLLPNDYHAYDNRAVAYTNQEKYDLALRDYKTALGLSPNNATLFNNRAAIFIARGQYKEAIEDYDLAIRLDPKQGRFYCNRSVAKRKAGYGEADGDAMTAKSLGVSSDCIH